MDDVAHRLRAALDLPAEASSDFDLNPGMKPPTRDLRAAAVLVPVFVGDGAPRVLLTKRSSALAHHPGQVAFPGGKVDPGDASPEAAALREAEEEVALLRDRVDVLGRLAPHVTVTGFSVTPVVGLIEGAFDPIPEAGEVAEAFFLPLYHVLDPARFVVEARRWQGMPRHYYALPYGPYYTWGATARMLRGLADRWDQCG